MRVILLGVLLALAAKGNATLVEPCVIGGIGTLNSMDVEGCEDGVNAFCELVKGNTYRFTIDANLGGFNASVLQYAYKLIFPVPTAFLEGNACDVLTIGECPVQSGDRFVFDAIFHVNSTSFPVLQTVIRAEVLDENEIPLICVQFKIAIVNP